jgi:hypothetical protein
MNELNGGLDLMVRAHGKTVAKQFEINIKPLIYLGLAGTLAIMSFWAVAFELLTR